MLESAFALFDVDGDGEISFSDLKQVAMDLNENMTDEELREMLIGASKGNKRAGYVQQNGFFSILNKSNQQ